MASTIIIKNKNTGAPSSLAAGELAINTTEGSLYYGSTGGTSVSSSFKFGALTSSTFTNTGDVVIGGSVGATAYNSTTSATGYKLNGVKFLWRDGGADLQVGNDSHKTDIIGVNIDLQAPVTASMISASAGFTGSNAFFDGNITSSGTISASGMIQTAGAISSSTGITASDAFFSGHITASNLSLAGTITHTGDTGTGIAFGENRINFAAGGQENLIVGRTGISTLIAGNALNIGAHAFTAKQLVANVTDGTAPMQITSTTVVANLNADKLDGADLIDEDDMSSDSATAVPTQQSVKAYVDASGGSVSGNTFATDLKVGRDADNLIDFTTDNQVTFRVSAGDGIVMKASGEIEATKFDGDLEGNADTATTATNATHVAVADNENTNEDNLIPFIEDASATGNVGLESDGDFHYNPSTGKLTATQLAGTLQTAAQTNITSVGTLSSVTVSGDVNANGNIVGDGATQLSGLTHITAIGNMALGNHATDDHTITGRTEIVGNITASGDISGSGAISTTSTIRGIMPQVISANMGGVALSTTTDTYIPLAEGELEGTNHDHVRVNLVAPFSGSLRRIVVRSNAAFGTDQAYTASLYVIHDDEVASGKTLAGHHQIGLDADKHSAHALVFDFANRVTGSNVINGGDRVLISLKSSRDNSQNYYCTTVFAWDYHETTGIVTNSDGVIAGVGGI